MRLSLVKKLKLATVSSAFIFSVNASPSDDLGFVLGIKDISQGYEVLEVRKGSLADKLKVKAGDRITAVHGQIPNEGNKNQIVAALNAMGPGSLFNVRIVSDGDEFELLSAIPEIRKASTEMCAYASLQGNPPKTRDVHNVSVKHVNGSPVNNRNRYKLDSGYNTLRLLENIKVQDIRYKLTSERHKNVRIYIEPGDQVYLGAQYLKAYRMETMRGKHWYPTIWKSKQVSCSM